MLEQLKLMPNEDGLLVGSSQGAGGASMFSSPPASSTAPSSSVEFCVSSKPLNSSESLFGARIPTEYVKSGRSRITSNGPPAGPSSFEHSAETR